MKYALFFLLGLFGFSPLFAQDVSPYTFSGIRLPLTGKELLKKVQPPAKCVTDQEVQVTTCHARVVPIGRVDSGTYVAEWEVNEPTGQVTAVTFLWRDTLRREYVDSLNARWGQQLRPFNTRSAWWGKPDGNWQAEVSARNGVMKLILRNSPELKAVSKRASELRQQKSQKQKSQ